MKMTKSENDRNAIIRGLRKSGKTLQSLGDEFHINKERVRQITKGIIPNKIKKSHYQKKLFRQTETTQKCIKCREWKDKAGFNKVVKHSNGLDYICRQCRKIYYNKTRERRIEVARLWNSTHPERNRINHKNWREHHLEKLKEKNKLWIKSPAGIIANRRGRHKRRALETMHTNIATKDEIHNLLKEQDNLCVSCDKNIAIDFTIDHVQPLSKGGSMDIGNIQLLCKSCNSKKGTKFIRFTLDKIGNMVYNGLESQA